MLRRVLPLMPGAIPDRRESAVRWSSTSSAEEQRMHDETGVIKLAEVEPSSEHGRIVCPGEVIELTQHCRSSGVECAAEGRAVRLVGMTREDPNDPISVARQDRFQSRHIAEDERWVVVGRACQATGMVEHD